jgi:hypothetical protein
MSMTDIFQPGDPGNRPVEQRVFDDAHEVMRSRVRILSIARGAVDAATAPFMETEATVAKTATRQLFEAPHLPYQQEPVLTNAQYIDRLAAESAAATPAANYENVVDLDAHRRQAQELATPAADFTRDIPNEPTLYERYAA